jgi:tRNA threonylcarbamoyladenosine biosynthesis protein TsaB
LIVLGLDTSTAATAVGLQLGDGTVLERRDDPPPGAHPGHATRLLAMTAQLLQDTGTSWEDIERIAVGLGPGTFTGLRVGVATARGLAHSRKIELVGVSSLQALALGALERSGAEDGRERPAVALAVIDARRGEVFAAAYECGPAGVPRRLTAPVALASERVAELVAGAREPAGGSWLLIGDGAVRYRELLGGAGLEVAAEGSPLHRVSGEAICVLGGSAGTHSGTGGALPDYVRRPDAELALEGA